MRRAARTLPWVVAAAVLLASAAQAAEPAQSATSKAEDVLLDALQGRWNMTGTVGSDRIVILYPYADGTFRNTFAWTAATRSWTLLIESQQANGRWTAFASNTLTPA